MGSTVDHVVQNNGICSNTGIYLSPVLEQHTEFSLCERDSPLSGDVDFPKEVKKTSSAEANYLKGGFHELISVNDILCVACKQMLFQPSVLNCGHVYCQSCIATLVSEAHKCQLCQSLQPKGFLKVCRELDHLLEKRFPKEYALRRETVQLNPFNDQQGEGQDGKAQCSQASSPHSWNYLSWFGEHGLNVHIGVGCDYCGMYPIVGERYKCKDCFEAIGFDLCGECYNTCSKLPGRFNQQHTPEHTFDLVKSNLIRSIMRRLVSEHSEDSSIPVLSDGASEDPEDGLPSQELSEDAPDGQEGDSHLTS